MQSPSIRDNEELFIIGGATLYKETIGMAENLYITHIHHIFDDADTFFPAIDTDKWEETRKNRNAGRRPSSLFLLFYPLPQENALINL